jgi:hypothetical protein
MKRATAMGAKIAGKPAQSWLGVPLLAQGESIGAIIIQDLDHEHAFDEDDLQFVMSVANQVSSSIYNIRVLEDSKQTALQFETAAEIARDISSSLDLDELLKKATDLIRSRFDFYHAAVFLKDMPGEFVVIREATGDAGYREVATGTLNYLLRELRRDDGTFAASQDADTDGEEGATFVWTAAEVREVLGDDAPAFSAAYDVTDDGNWEGRTILRRVTPVGDGGFEARLAGARDRLLARRQARPQPTRDDKALAAWNGLAIRALADAREPRFVDAAVAAADQILGGLRRPDGRLGRSWKDGRSTGEGVLEDYANLADGLLALYQATFDERWFTAARDLADAILAHFGDPSGGFFDTADDHETLVTRPKDVQDNAVPSGGSMAATVLLRLAALTGESRYREAADAAIATVTPYVARYPTGFANWLSAAHLAVEGSDELAIVGDPADDATQELMVAGVEAARVAGRNLVVAVSTDPDASAVPLLDGRTMIDGRPTAYLCRNFACRLPVTDPAALAAEFRASPSMPFLA